MNQISQIISTLEPFFLIGTLIGSGILAFTVYTANKNNSTNRIFALLSFTIVIWMISGYLAPRLDELSIFFHRLAITFAAPMSTFFLLLSYSLPDAKKIPRKFLITISLLTVLMMAINVSPLAFVGTKSGNPVASLWILPFAIISTIFSVWAIYLLIKKLFVYKNIKRGQIKLILSGISLMILFIITTILVPIIFYDSGIFLSFLPVYALLFLGTTAYAITKYQLFNIKIIVTKSITIVLWLILFSRIFISDTLTDATTNTIIFISVLFFGIFLIRSVQKEVKQREEIEGLAQELREVNTELFSANEKLKELDKKKTEFVSIASHQLRSPLTAIKGYSSMLLEGSYGKLSKDVTGAVDAIFQSSQRLVTVIEDFLNITRIELGKMKYEMSEFDIKDLAKQLVADYKQVANKKGLEISFDAKNKGKFMVYGDIGKISQVISNMIDNSIKYTPSGSVTISTVQNKGFIQVRVKDTGVGLKAEEINKLFKKFVRADDAGKVNISGTGLGMYVAKQIIEAHDGRIFAESEGKGKGSTFILELPDKIADKHKKEVTSFAQDL